ncbi:energy transducer TonB [Niabella soli]|uniref:TonB C-terminal domain-containing protein n=1 Tax=Niabella soli DSM 19437 TaxID=929713 RepID=W0F3X0_9BACT|nr:energy transducer TonB [Niabella soli]AHF17745.1 hypothetical protein NIASO_13580 [Niabella soli DSM 19437]
MWVDFFYIKDNKKLFSASFSDTALNVLQGRSIEYNPSGHASALKNYKANVLDGLMEKWDSLGQLTDSVIYKDGVVALKKRFFYARKSLINEVTTDSINNTLLDISYDSTGKKSREIYFSGDKGIEKIYLPDGTEKTGDSLYSREERAASFPGRGNAFGAYLTQTLDPKVPYQNGAPAGSYRVIVQFIIDKDGYISNIRALTQMGYGMEDEVIRLIKNSGRWVPAMQYGRPVKAYRKQPVTFLVQR